MVALKMYLLLTRVLIVAAALLLGSVVQASEIVLLEFSSSGCAPCQEMRPIVQRVAAAGYRVRHVDITRESALTAQFKVDQVPTFIAFVDGREHARMVGTGTFEQLQEMLTPQNAAVRGQSPDPTNQQPRQQQSISQLASVSGNAQPLSTYSGLENPSAGRIIEIQDPSRVPTRNSPPAGNPFGNSVPNQVAIASPPSAAHAQLLQATVKISVEDADGTSAGTGTIVDARDGAALVLTCGHLFRTSAGKGPIEITFYQATPAGAQVRETAPGQLLNYDLERDLALVIVRPQAAVKALPIAPLNTPLVPGSAVTTVGCNGGDNPTAIDSQITTIDRYQGPPNVEVAGAPVEGRSGGGLFNGAGQLVGVCFAADPQSNEGLYASLPSIQAKLDSLNLAMVYQTPSTQVAATPTKPASPVAAAPPQSVAVRGQDELVDRLPDEFASVPAPSAPRQSLSTSEQAALEEIQNRGLKSEVICIIRPHDPGGKSEVITLNNVSPEFVNSLANPPSSLPLRSPATAAAGQLLR
ncbi:MAG: trypsin-like peptidase domain-containing protein [Bythopirellula sp.]|nr:trypsin-like peptidase domain-containing protein [Bythopirellula sp.]